MTVVAAAPGHRLGRMIPNLLSGARLALAPVCVGLIATGRLRAACVTFLLAGVTDGIDGWYARRFHAASELGAYLDAIADKVLIAAVYLTLAVWLYLPWWLAVLVVGRDVAIVAGAAVLQAGGRAERIPPSWPSKVNTALEIALAAALLWLEGRSWSDHIAGWMVSLELVVIVSVAVSLGGYALAWGRRLARRRRTG